MKYSVKVFPGPLNTPDRGQLKTLIISTKVDKKSLETDFSIAICPPAGDKWQSKTLLLVIIDPRSLIDKSTFDCHLSGVHKKQSDQRFHCLLF